MINLYGINIKSWFDKIKFSNKKILYNKMFNEYVIKCFERGVIIYMKIVNGIMDKCRCESLYYFK